MSRSHRLLLHVGYHKTATTWMQLRLFTPELGYTQVAGHEEVFEKIVRPHRLCFDPEPMHRHVAAALDRMPENSVPVISSELLVGNMFYGGRESEDYAERLREIFGDARILISIRSQMQILPSVYMQYLSRGGTMTPAQFFAGASEPGYFGFDPAHFEYDRLVHHYQSLFGRDNVLVVLQEALQADMDTVAKEIAIFSRNASFRSLTDSARKVQSASFPEYAVPLLRRANHLQKGAMNPAPILNLSRSPRGLYRAVGYLARRNPLAVRFKQHRPVSDFVHQHFTGYYSASNARLKELVGGTLSLQDYD